MFSKSDRICFQPTYNPPVGFYEISNKPNSRGLDFSKSLSREKEFKQTEDRQSVSPANYNYNLPKVSLASPQLSAYAKPGERLKIEKKHQRQERRSFSYSQNPDISINNYEKIPYKQRGKIIKINYQKHTTDVENSTEDTTQKLHVQGYYNQQTRTTSASQTRRRKPKTHRNIFSLFPSDSLELAQQREKMKDKPVPPPGAYHNEFTSSSIKVEKIPWRFQCFSSSVRRFSQAQESMPSVGTYNIEIKPKITGVIPLAKQTMRKEEIKNYPGVGTYEVDKSFTQPQIKHRQQENFPCPFGSSGKRF